MSVEAVKPKRRKPTIRQQKAAIALVENGGNVSKAMVTAGYSETTAHTPSKLTDSEGWQVLMDRVLPDMDVIEKHRELMNAQRLDHMVFPLGPEEGTGEDTTDNEDEDAEGDGGTFERMALTDDEIRQLLGEVSCKVRKIVHGRTARHVYFWSPDNKARKEAVEMAYKLKGKYAADRIPPAGNTYNIFYQPQFQARVKAFETDIKDMIANESPQTPEAPLGSDEPGS